MASRVGIWLFMLPNCKSSSTAYVLLVLLLFRYMWNITRADDYANDAVTSFSTHGQMSRA